MWRAGCGGAVNAVTSSPARMVFVATVAEDIQVQSRYKVVTKALQRRKPATVANPVPNGVRV